MPSIITSCDSFASAVCPGDVGIHCNISTQKCGKLCSQVLQSFLYLHRFTYKHHMLHVRMIARLLFSKDCTICMTRGALCSCSNTKGNTSLPWTHDINLPHPDVEFWQFDVVRPMLSYAAFCLLRLRLSSCWQEPLY